MANFIRSVASVFYLKPVRRVLPFPTFLYFVGGTMNTVLGWILYFVLFRFVMNPIGTVNLGFINMTPHITTLFVQFPITFGTGFWLNRNVAFADSNLGATTQVWRYVVSTAGAFLLNYFLLKILVELFIIVAPLAKVLTDVVVTAYSYVMQRYFSFKVKKEASE